MLVKKLLLLMLIAWAIGMGTFASAQAAWPGEGAAPAGQPNVQDLMTMRIILNTMRNISNNPSATMVAGTKCVYLLSNGVLAQYDGNTPEPLHQLQLFGPLPAQPAADAPLADRLKYSQDVVRRMASATMLLTTDYLVIVTNSVVFCVDPTTLKLKSATNIALADQPVQQTFRLQQAGLMTAPTAQVLGHIAYVLQGADRLIVVDLLGGTVLGRSKLPATITTALLTDLFTNEINQGGVWPGGGGGGRIVPPPAVGGVDVQKTITLIGTVHHMDLEGGFWAFDDRNGQKYSLTGDKLKDLTATPNIEGARVRITGIVGNTPGIAQYGNGSFSVTEFQVMPAAQ